MLRWPRAVGAIAVVVSVCATSASAWADGVPIEDAKPAQLGAAQKTFEAADQLYDSQQYEAAIKAYRTSSEIVASPNSLLMIARSMQKLGNVAGAYAELENAVGLAERAAGKDAKYAPTLKAVRDELAALKSKVGVLHLQMASVPPGTSVTVGDRPVDVAALSKPVIVAPGSVTVVARADGFRDVRRDVNVAAGQEANVDLALAPAAADKEQPTETTAPPAPEAPAPTGGSGLRTGAFIAGGIGVVGLIGFGVFGAMHLSKYNDLKDKCPNNQCPSDVQSEIDTGRTFETVANVGLIVGIVGVATGVTLFAISAKKKSTAPPASAASLSVAPGSFRFVGHF